MSVLRRVASATATVVGLLGLCVALVALYQWTQVATVGGQMALARALTWTFVTAVVGGVAGLFDRAAEWGTN